MPVHRHLRERERERERELLPALTVCLSAELIKSSSRLERDRHDWGCFLCHAAPSLDGPARERGQRKEERREG